MKIALDATVVRPPLTGVHYAVRHGAQALLAGGGDWLCLATDPALREAAGAMAPPLPASLRRVSRRILWQQCQLPGLLRRERCEGLFAMAYTAPRRCPVPYVLLLHDLIALRHPELCSRLNALHMRLLMPGSIARAAGIVVSANAVADDLHALTGYPREQITVAPMGVDAAYLATPVEAPLPPGCPVQAPYLLWVGTTEPKKGLETLLAAYRQVAERLPELSLVLAGRDGWRCAALRREIDGWHGPGRVVSLGYVPREWLPALSSHALAQAVPSRVEGFGLPMLEAMARGTPVIHSDHPVLIETAGGHGLPFPVGNAEALAAAIARLAGDEALRQRLGGAGRAWAHAHTWDAWAAIVRQTVVGRIGASR